MVLVESRSGQNDIGAIVDETFSRMFNITLDHIEKIEILPEIQYNERVKELDDKSPRKENWGVTFRNTETGKYLILVKESDDINELIVIIGHEIGHTLYPIFHKVPGLKSLEEAKAYSFQNLWADTIKKYNIGNFGATVATANQSLVEGPLNRGAKAGVHYFGSLIANSVDKGSPGRLYNILNSTKNPRQLAYNLMEKFRYKSTPN